MQYMSVPQCGVLSVYFNRHVETAQVNRNSFSKLFCDKYKNKTPKQKFVQNIYTYKIQIKKDYWGYLENKTFFSHFFWQLYFSTKSSYRLKNESFHSQVFLGLFQTQSLPVFEPDVNNLFQSHCHSDYCLNH